MDLKEYILPKSSMIGGWYLPPAICDDIITLFKDNKDLLDIAECHPHPTHGPLRVIGDAARACGGG